MVRSYLFRVGAFVVACLMMADLSCKKNEGPVGPGASAAIIGQLAASPNSILANTPTDVTIHLTVPAGVQLVDSTVMIVRLDASGNQTGVVGSLYDDGSLIHGDEIIADNVYSTIVTLNEPIAGQLVLRAVATIKSPTPFVSSTSSDFALPVYRAFTAQEIGAMKSTYDSSEVKLKQLLAASPSSLSTLVNQLSTWLQTKPEVASVENSGGNSILVRFVSGLNGGILISQEDAGGHIATRASGEVDRQRRMSRAVPVSKQTTGSTSMNGLRRVSAFAALDPNVIGNRNVLIWAPFEDVFPANERPSIEALLANSGYDFSVTTYVNAAATVRMLTHMTDYGLVILATHGAEGKEFGTTEIIDTGSAIYKSTYSAMMAGGENAQLGVWENVVITAGWVFKTRADIYSVRYPFIRNLAGRFPNSVILNNSCWSAKTQDFWDAFSSKGAKSYYGYDLPVSCSYCVTNADTLISRLCKDLKNTGQSFDISLDPASPHAMFKLLGSQSLHYVDSLLNGDFEAGTIDGWTKSGDGRAISKLASITPPGGSYMGVVSTGLGYTTSSGSISQTFHVRQGQSTLTVKWNFLSEEFLEFIGSKFQDYFQIVIKNAAGTESVLLNATIDGLASQFGATKQTAGSLTFVSPDIVFDRGDVYMTGWQTSTFPISQFAGQKITLILRAGDVGDSIYDTAILLDDIAVQ